MIILISFIHITDNKHKDRKSCYKKYTVHRCSDNIGITNCTTDTVTKNLPEICRLSKSLVEIEYDLFPAAELNFHLGTNICQIKFATNK